MKLSSSAPPSVDKVWPGKGFRLLCALGSLGAMAVLFLLSSRSSLPLPRLHFPGLDKLLHAAAYSILGALLQLGWGVRRSSLSLLPAVIIATLYGVLDEVHQGHVPGRDSCLYDVLADFSGAVFGAVIVWKAGRRRLTPPVENKADDGEKSTTPAS